MKTNPRSSTKANKRTPVVAQLTVTSSEGAEIINSFDAAWHRAGEIWATQDLPTPVNIKFNGFIRID